MALILRGKRKGERFTPHQWCNDWMTDTESGEVHSLGSVQLEGEEVWTYLKSDEAQYVARFYTFDPVTGRFTKIKRQ